MQTDILEQLKDTENRSKNRQEMLVRNKRRKREDANKKADEGRPVFSINDMVIMTRHFRWRHDSSSSSICPAILVPTHCESAGETSVTPLRFISTSCASKTIRF